MKFLFRVCPAVMFVYLASCSQNLGGYSATSPQAKPTLKPTVRPAAESVAKPAVASAPLPESAPQKQSLQPTLSAEQISQECWFAVSGTYVGLGDYEDTFPKPKSGKPIAQAEVFDTVGGVFLYARNEPYVYGQGAKEIDLAVNYTFDGIVVPPGMSVDIRASASESPIFKGEGPLIAIAGSGTEGYGSPLTYKAQYDGGALKRWPQWMQDYLRDNEGKVKLIPLHPARWVKVSVVDGGRCASQ